MPKLQPISPANRPLLHTTLIASLRATYQTNRVSWIAAALKGPPRLPHAVPRISGAVSPQAVSGTPAAFGTRCQNIQKYTLILDFDWEEDAACWLIWGLLALQDQYTKAELCLIWG
jgi:hypothetical protein